MMFRVPRVEYCSVARAGQGVIVFAPDLLAAVNAAVKLPHEFMLYLRGVHDRFDWRAHVDDVDVPRQYVGAAAVSAIDIYDPAQYIGVLHSHHNMPAFHSQTDRLGVDNAPISVIASQHGILAQMAVTLPCGRLGVIAARVSDDAAAVPVRPATTTVADYGDCPAAAHNPLPCGLYVDQHPLIRRILAASFWRDYYAC